MNIFRRGLLAATVALAGAAAFAQDAAIPEAATAKLTAAINKVVAMPEYAKFLESRGVEKETPPADVYVKSGPDELRQWGETVKISGAKIDYAVRSTA